MAVSCTGGDCAAGAAVGYRGAVGLVFEQDRQEVHVEVGERRAMMPAT